MPFFRIKRKKKTVKKRGKKELFTVGYGSKDERKAEEGCWWQK